MDTTTTEIGENTDDFVSMRDQNDRNNSRPKSSVSLWRVLGRKIPSQEMVFCCQMTVIFIVVIASIYNLSSNGNEKTELWTALLSSSLGYVLPSPRLRR